MTVVSDADLVEAVRSGDRAAFDALYRRYLGGVGTVVRAQLRDPDQAAEVVQETFARALEALPRLTTPARFRPWLFAIARHTAVDARRVATRSGREVLETIDDVAAPGPDVRELAEIAELAGLVRGAVAGLSRRDATAIGLVALGFGVPEVAGALGIRRGAAKVALLRARRRLKTRLLMDLAACHQTPACPELERLRRNDPVAVGQHLEGCRACQEAVRSALH